MDCPFLLVGTDDEVWPAWAFVGPRYVSSVGSRSVGFIGLSGLLVCLNNLILLQRAGASVPSALTVASPRRSKLRWIA